MPKQSYLSKENHRRRAPLHSLKGLLVGEASICVSVGKVPAIWKDDRLDQPERQLQRSPNVRRDASSKISKDL